MAHVNEIGFGLSPDTTGGQRSQAGQQVGFIRRSCTEKKAIFHFTIFTANLGILVQAFYQVNSIISSSALPNGNFSKCAHQSRLILT